MKIPESHPRYASLMSREKIVRGVEKGITSLHGLIAQGRGEAFDYLLGEKSHNFAMDAMTAGVAALLLAKNPAISVNGNAASLCAEDISRLAKAINAAIEVNIFHASALREKKIKKEFLRYGAKALLPSKRYSIGFLEHNRRFANKKGILVADVVLVPLEDGDRCEALRKMGKKIIAIDLNPMSRTAKAAHITIVDNITRAIPFMIKIASSLKRANVERLRLIVSKYDNRKTLHSALKQIRH